MTATSSQRKAVLKTLLSISHTILPADLSQTDSKNGAWLWWVLSSSNALDHSVWPFQPSNADLTNDTTLEVSLDPEEDEIRSELHTYVGLTEGDVRSASRLHSQSVTLRSAPDLTDNPRTVARAFVYDFTNYTPSNKYGPMLANLQGKLRASWKHLEQIMVVILWNLQGDELPLVVPLPGETPAEMMTRCRPPMALDALRPWSAPGFQGQLVSAIEWEAKHSENVDFMERSPSDGTTWHEWDDWAGVEGCWNRLVCFMDYPDFRRFNPLRRRNRPRDVSIFEDPDFAEATRFMVLELRLSFIECNPPSSQPLSPAAIRLNRPRLYFTGTSRESVLGATGQRLGQVTGWVECLASEDVRWHMVRRDNELGRWSSEGVQIGGVGSARGVIGTWTGEGHAPMDPVGPFWLWKVAGRESLPRLINKTSN